MIDQNELYNKFSTFSFVSYAKAVRSILSAYKIVNVTIDKITDKINNGDVVLSMCTEELSLYVMIVGLNFKFPINHMDPCR